MATFAARAPSFESAAGAADPARAAIAGGGLPAGPSPTGEPPVLALPSSYATVADAIRTDSRPTVGGPSPAQPSPLAPGGASTSAGASAGIALTLFGLAALLLLGRSQATRRLRLASKPRRPAPFVLIPVPPG